MKQSETPLWKKSMLDRLNLDSIREYLWEISDNGDMYGYEGGDEGYYQDYKDLFDDLSAMAYNLLEALGYEVSDDEKAMQDGTHEIFKEFGGKAEQEKGED